MLLVSFCDVIHVLTHREGVVNVALDSFSDSPALGAPPIAPSTRLREHMSTLTHRAPTLQVDI
jgi:hypothetical protein